MGQGVTICIVNSTLLGSFRVTDWVNFQIMKRLGIFLTHDYPGSNIVT